MIRERLSGDLKEAIEDGDTARVSTLRLICAAIKDRDSVERSDDGPGFCADADILAILGRMIAQRIDSATALEEAGQCAMAAQERDEIRIIRSYLPKQMSEQEMRTAVEAAIAECGACSIRDVGKVMAKLKAEHPGKMDFTRAGAAVKQAFR